MKYIYVYESPEPQLTVITPEYCKSYGEYGWTTNILKPVAKIPVKDLQEETKQKISDIDKQIKELDKQTAKLYAKKKELKEGLDE